MLSNIRSVIIFFSPIVGQMIRISEKWGENLSSMTNISKYYTYFVV